MVMTSQMISQMAASQTAMFGQFQSYSQQINPFPSGGYMAGPAPMPPPLTPWSPHSPAYGGSMLGMMPYAQPGSGYSQALGSRMVGGGISLASAGVEGLSTLSGIAGTVGTIGSIAGIGGMGALSAAGGLGVTAPLALAGYGLGLMGEGVQQRQAVGGVLQNRFGGAYGVGGGMGGYGFNNREIGQMSTMLREMGTDDVFGSMEELTRVLDRTAQMGAYKGVQSAQEFRMKFKKVTESLKEIAQTMNTTLEEATQFMDASKNMGFFSGQDISRNLMQTRLGATASGMSVGQLQQIGQMGSQMGMSMGWRGSTGAQAAQNIATNIGTGVRTGALSEEMLFNATGGLTGAEGVQALTSRMMQVNNRFLSRGAGRVLTAAAWDPTTGGVNQAMVERIQRGELSFQEARRIARQNIREGGGNGADFLADEERIRGQMLEAGGSDMAMGMIETHLQRRGITDLNDPRAERFLRRRMGYSQSEVEALQQMRTEMPRIMAERRAASRQEMSNMLRTRGAENRGLQGIRQQWSRWWEQEVENPARQAADDLINEVSRGVDEMINDFTGQIQVNVSSRTKSMFQEWARTGVRPAGMATAQELTEFRQQARLVGSQMDDSFMTSLGRVTGARSQDTAHTLRAAKAGQHGLSADASAEERDEFIRNMNRDLATGYASYGVTSPEMRELGNRALDITFSSLSSSQRQALISNRSNSDKAMNLAKKQISMLVSRDEQLKEYFGRAGEGERSWYKKYRLLADLQSEGEFGLLGVDAGAIVGGGADVGFATTLKGAKEMQRRANRRLAEVSGSREWKKAIAEGGIGGVNAASITSWIDRTLGYRSNLTELGRLGIRNEAGGTGGAITEGAQVSESVMNRLIGNEELRQDLALARSGDENARRRVIRASVSEGGDAAYGVSSSDRDELRTLAGMLEGSDEQVAALDAALANAQNVENLVVTDAIKKKASVISRTLATNSERLKSQIGNENYEAVQNLLALQEQGDIQGAIEAEQKLMGKIGGRESGEALLGFLREKGVAFGLQEGLSTAQDYRRHYQGSERDRTRILIQSTLSSKFGITGSRANRLLRGGTMRRIMKGDLTGEQAGALMYSRLSQKEKEGLEERGITQDKFVSMAQENLGIASGGFSDEELNQQIAQRATAAGFTARTEGAGKDDPINYPAKSLKELQNVTSLLKVIATKGLSIEEGAVNAIINAQNNGDGGGNTGSPGGNSTSGGGSGR